MINFCAPFGLRNRERAEALFQSPHELTAFDPETGSRLWSYAAGMPTIPSPVGADGIIVIPGGASVAIAPGGVKLWTSKALNVGTPTPTIHQGKVYAVSSAGVVVCADAKTGDEIWKSRAKGPHSASPVIAGDRMYLVNEAGETTVLKLGEEPQVLAVNPLNDPMQASPAVWGGALYLRSDQRLYCIGK
jgi:outer membrane protein assembly factor BamB